MRVLFQIRRSYRELAGGDVTVMRRTAEYLRRFGVEVDDSCDADLDLQAYDLVHVIDSSPGEETFALGMNAIERRKPLILTPLYWDAAEYEERGRWQPAALEEPGDPSRARRLRAVRDQVSTAKRRFLVEMADLVLPSSETERHRLQIDLGVEHERFQVVPFAAEASLAEGSAEEFVQQYGLRDFVLCVARIEDNKNQLALVEACRRLGQPLVLIGPPNPLQPGYVEACRQAAGTAPLLVLGYVERRLLDAAYAAAKVHALASWWEIPGLASLDGAAAGCNVVVSDRGSAREYLGDLAWYCDPGDIGSIASAVAAAHAAPRSTALRDHVCSHYSWERTAQATLSAYRRTLAGHLTDGRPRRATAAAWGRRTRLLEELARAQESHLWLKSLVNEDLARQLAEHRAVLADRERQLTEHRAVLADRERRLDVADGVRRFADGVRRFAEHGAVLAERVRRAAAEHGAVLADRERQLAAHKAVLADRETPSGEPATTRSAGPESGRAAPAHPPRVADVSIALLTKNGARTLRASLEAIHRGSLLPAEILAVDSGSTDATLAILHDFPVRLHQIAPAEFSHSRTRNLAAQLATGKYIVFLSQDAEPAGAGWLAALMENLEEDPRVAGVCSRILPRPESNPVIAMAVYLDPQAGEERLVASLADPSAYDQLSPLEKRLLTPFHDISSCLRRELLVAMPFPDVDFAEDLAWAHQALRRGLRIVFEPRSQVRHAHAYTPRQIYARTLADARAVRALFHRRNVERLGDVPILVWRRCVQDARYMRVLGLPLRVRAGWLWHAFLLHTAEYAGHWAGSRRPDGRSPGGLNEVEVND